jgi:hypothetical protein
LFRPVAHDGEGGLGDGLGGEGAGAVAAVDAGLLDVLEDAADDNVALAVADGVDVELDGAVFLLFVFSFVFCFLFGLVLIVWRVG